MARLIARARRAALLESLLHGLARLSLPTVHRLGDVYRVHAGSPERALACYRAVLAEAPDHAGGRAGMSALLDNPQCRPAAVKLLLDAFEATGDWAGRLSLLERLDADAAVWTTEEALHGARHALHEADARLEYLRTR